MQRTMTLGAIAVLATATAAIAGPFDTLEFEDLVTGTTYNTGGSFTTEGVLVSLEEFFWLPNGSTINGFAEVIDPNLAGAGNGMFLNNTNLNFHFPFPQTILGVRFFNEGGNVNLTINGTLLNAGTLSELDGTLVDGVLVSIAPGAPGEDEGFLQLLGTVNSFSLGGQELNIDDFRYQIPSPGALALFGIGGLAAMRRRR